MKMEKGVEGGRWNGEVGKGGRGRGGRGVDRREGRADGRGGRGGREMIGCRGRNEREEEG